MRFENNNSVNTSELTNKHNRSFESIISFASKDLLAAKNAKIEKPAFYYLAYKAYTLEYWTGELTNIFPNCSPQEKQKINNLFIRCGINPIPEEKGTILSPQC